MDDQDRVGATDTTFAAIKLGVIALLSLPIFLFLGSTAAPWMLALNHMMVILGAYAVGDVVARRVWPVLRR